MASRILGMGDILTMIEKAQESIDEEQSKKMVQKMKKNQFDFEDYLESMHQMKKMGGIRCSLKYDAGDGRQSDEAAGRCCG
ncbi:MAG: hypothetical protein ACLTTO_08225 [Lachnospiraceae bacterium]